MFGRILLKYIEINWDEIVIGFHRILMVDRSEGDRNPRGNFGDEEGSRCDTETKSSFGRKRNTWTAENF
jgi:hypothetical protein